MDIQVGDRVTYKCININKEDLEIELIKDNIMAEDYKNRFENNFWKLFKVERIGENGWYTVYEDEIFDNDYDEMLENYELNKKIEKIKAALEEVKDIQSGKIEAQTWDEFKQELDKECDSILTEEEREFLRLWIKFSDDNDNYYLEKYDNRIEFYNDESCLNDTMYINDIYFKKLDLYMRYSLEELRIGGIDDVIYYFRNISIFINYRNFIISE